ncbi:MAG: response regulator, partial [Gammaproteobacteria bacterium]|nr:response regulator [Gammaproteobacteria bacterium]
FLRTYLESWHCQSEEAVTAKEAMKKLHEAVTGNNPFQIALLDHYMPEADGESLCKEIKADPQFNDLILVMLTSVGSRGDAERFKSLGFAAYLHKPIKQSLLLDCLRIVTGQSSSIEKETTDQIVTQYSISEDQKQRIHILLVEDNVVNQNIALAVLENKLGYHTDAAANGKEAVESLERFDYDLVLMDCQMPVMDGYEATGTIRNLNSDVRNHNIPIVAMTANAMQGDRKKCLDAGMDDYVTKPININELADTIARNLSNVEKQRDNIGFQNSPDHAKSDGDSEFKGKDQKFAIRNPKLKNEPDTIYSEYADEADLVELIDAFVAGLEDDVKAMRKVLNNFDYDGLRRLAHQMKGAGGSYGYQVLTEAAKVLEEKAKAKDS